MQQPLISAPDKKDLDKFTKFLCLKAAQVIVQGRLGKTISTQCSPTPNGAEWFNLAIKDYPDIQKEAKSALIEGNPSFQSSFVVEMSLRTSDSESLTLEVWSLSVMKKYEDVRVHHTVYNRMSLLLKSLICVSRATPAYKLSRKQGSEYVICFRVYTGKADIAGLGEGFKTLRVGSIGTPTGTITLSVAFRTTENLHVSTKRLAPDSCGPMKVSHDHFCSPRSATMSPARPCHTLRSRLMNSREFSSGSQSSSGPLESPSYGLLPTSFSTSPSDMESSRNKGAMFTIGTPPSNLAHGRTPPRQTSSPLLSGMRRKLSDATPPREGVIAQSTGRKTRSVIHSQSEQNFSDPRQYYGRKEHRRKTIQEEIFPAGKLFDGTKVPASLPQDSSMHSTLKNEESVFRPISSSPLEERKQPSPSERNVRQSGVRSISRSSHRKGSNVDVVTTLKSHSPTSARVGFPDNTLTTLHLTHIPPSLDVTASAGTMVFERSQQHQLFMPSPGAFVSNSKTARRAYNTLNEISTDTKLPFEDLLSDDTMIPDKHTSRSKTKNSRYDSSSDTSPESVRENSGTITRLSSQSSLSSHPSSESSPQKDDIPSPPRLTDEFLMIDLNPAFGKSDSAKDLCAFYREIESAPDLLMFQENSGRETQETLIDLTKQLEDYQKDAEGFDEFVKELEVV